MVDYQKGMAACLVGINTKLTIIATILTRQHSPERLSELVSELGEMDRMIHKAVVPASSSEDRASAS